jgi:hypothetical protein
MTYKAKVAVCSKILTKHSTQSEYHVVFLNVKPGGTKRNRKETESFETRNAVFGPGCLAYSIMNNIGPLITLKDCQISNF